MWFELLNLILGIAFGFLHRGKEDYYALLKNGVIAGLVLGIILVLAAQHFFRGGKSLDLGNFGVPGIFMEIFIFLAIFILGAFTGDWLERVFRK